MSAQSRVLDHARQQEAGRLHLLAGRTGQRVVASFGQALFHTMALAPGRVVRLTSQAELEWGFLTAHQCLGAGWLGAVGHQQEAEDAAIQHLVPTHLRMAGAGE
jgi:hypothetical protein